MYRKVIILIIIIVSAIIIISNLDYKLNINIKITSNESTVRQDTILEPIYGFDKHGKLDTVAYRIVIKKHRENVK